MASWVILSSSPCVKLAPFRMGCRLAVERHVSHRQPER